MKKVRTLVFAVIIVFFIAWAYSSKSEVAPIDSSTTDQSVGTIGVGQTALINGVRITLNSIVQDSRCPIDVQCIHAGAINTNVTFESVSEKETRNMSSDEVTLSFDSYKISIEAINPPRLSGKETAQNEYRITFRVEPVK